MGQLETYKNIVERYVQLCYDRRPPTPDELGASTVEESIAEDVRSFSANVDEVMAIVHFMTEYDHNPEIVDYIERIRYDRIPERFRNKVASLQKLLSQA
jgi:hypothetical protein